MFPTNVKVWFVIERVGCHETCQKKYQNNKYGPLCDKVDVGTTACLQPERGVLLLHLS